ncbi:MAG: efflux RND transporter periplasmic adaptor subunit [Verrucomicrobia bacterium]|nr:efflux RND transporter periplasmic adaptor subunit [Verrucomicrobiota bacterium]
MNHGARSQSDLFPVRRALRLLALFAMATVVTTGCGKGGPGGHGGWAVKVRTDEARRQPLAEKIALVASVDANERITVKSEIDGAVATINFEEGQPVTNGQLLITLDTRKLDASVAEAEATFALAETNRKRAGTMLANQTISQQEFDQAVATFAAQEAMLERTRQQLRDAAIVAPFDGLAGARQVSEGQVIGREMVLTTLVDIQPVKVEFRVPERYLGALQVGQAIAFHVPAYPDEEFRGDVYFIEPQVDPQTRTVLVKARQANADGRLRPGMFGNLDLILNVKSEAVVVPESAVMYDGDRATVYIVSTNQTAEMTDVTIGLRTAGLVEIAQGLQGGEQVIVEGLQKLQPGAAVMPAPLSATEPVATIAAP